MRLKESALQRGDTIVEVLFAVAVFAMVAVGSLSIMNQGTATAQRSLEITLVRQQIDAQAEAIRYIHQSYVTAFQKEGGVLTDTAAEWAKMTSKTAPGGRGADNPSNFSTISADGTCPANVPGQYPFLLNARKAEVWNGSPIMTAPAGSSLPPFAQVVYNTDSSVKQAYGMWIEAVPSNTLTNGPGFVDFHIRACWYGPGDSAPMTLGTIVRLYEPR
jgi:type II secretory pathway pseudopilin PulG